MEKGESYKDRLAIGLTTVNETLAGGVLILLWLKWKMVEWSDVSQPLQIFLLFLGLITACKILRRSYKPKEHPQVILQFTMAVFSLALLAKILLNIRTLRYGFALAMPATLVTVAALWDWIPQILAKFGGKTAVFRAVVLAVLSVVAIAHISNSNQFFKLKNQTVGTNADTFRTDARGEFINEAIVFLTKNAKYGDTLAVIPEGIMLNYLLRMPPPTKYTIYLPPVMMLFGQENMLSSLQKHPPDWIVLIHRDDSEYGFQFFCKDYGKLLCNWINEHYEGALRIGEMPFTSEYFGILILKHKTTSDAKADLRNTESFTQEVSSIQGNLKSHKANRDVILY